MRDDAAGPDGSALSEGLGPSAWRCEWRGDNDSSGWDQWHDASDPMPTKWEGTPPDEVTAFYDSATVRKMLEGAWCAGYYDAGYTHDSAYACKMAEKCADEFLGPNVGIEPPRSGRLE